VRGASFDFTGKTALVTGATRGIGLAIASELLASGANVTLTGRRSARLEEACRQLGSGDRVLAVEGSADNVDQVATALEQTISRFGACNVLVNNAGTNPVYGPLLENDLSAVEKLWAVNLTGPLLFARAAWHTWMKRHGGSILNVASIGGVVPLAGTGAYNVGKAGLIAMTRQLARELAPHVRVNALAPGVVKTRLASVLFADREREAALVAHYPLGRLGVPEDIIGAALFLLSDAASWVTGATLVVDGGHLTSPT
jgi:3-oxoacyl-[acyl-carrier protein] reductase